MGSNNTLEEEKMKDETYNVLRMFYYGAIVILIAHTFEIVRNFISILDKPMIGGLSPIQGIAIWVGIGTILAYNRNFG